MLGVDHEGAKRLVYFVEVDDESRMNKNVWGKRGQWRDGFGWKKKMKERGERNVKSFLFVCEINRYDFVKVVGHHI